MRAAAADVSLQGLHDFRFAGIGIFLEERDAADDHSRRAISALERALIEKSLLHGMKLAVLFETFDSEDGFSIRVANGKLAGTPRRAVQQNGASAALAFAAAVFGSGKAELLAQGEKQGCIWIRFENAAFSVDLCVDWPCHVVLDAPRTIAGAMFGFSLRLGENEDKSLVDALGLIRPIYSLPPRRLIIISFTRSGLMPCDIPVKADALSAQV